MSIKHELVERDTMGYWVHSQIPETEDFNVFEEWTTKNELDYTLTHMDCDLGYDHSVFKSYFEEGDINISNWEPSKPGGFGWFIGGIYETEDGPVCIWLRAESERLKEIFLKAHREAEKAAFEYFRACDVGEERIQAGEIYQRIRTATRIGC
ncbi:hypothetical protein AB7W95_17410 [Providencia rettgeri]